MGRARLRGGGQIGFIPNARLGVCRIPRPCNRRAASTKLAQCGPYRRDHGKRHSPDDEADARSAAEYGDALLVQFGIRQVQFPPEQSPLRI